MRGSLPSPSGDKSPHPGEERFDHVDLTKPGSGRRGVKDTALRRVPWRAARQLYMVAFCTTYGFSLSSAELIAFDGAHLRPLESGLALRLKHATCPF